MTLHCVKVWPNPVTLVMATKNDKMDTWKSLHISVAKSAAEISDVSHGAKLSHNWADKTA
jgi:hypothetical protein